MNARQIVSRLEALSTKLWEEALRTEKLHDLVDDLADKTGDIEIKFDGEFERKNFCQQQAGSKLRNLSFALSGLDGQFQELAWSIDRIIEDLDELVPPKRLEKSYKPPDAWK